MTTTAKPKRIPILWSWPVTSYTAHVHWVRQVKEAGLPPLGLAACEVTPRFVDDYVQTSMNARLVLSTAGDVMPRD